MTDCREYRSAYGDVDDYGERAARELETVILREGPETVGAVVLEPITAGGGVNLRLQAIGKQFRRSAKNIMY